MATYVLLMKFTDQGIHNIKDGPARVDRAMAAWESMGGKVHGFYMTMGEYDYVAIGEGPDDKTAAAYCLALGMAGDVKTTTLKAFPIDEAKAIMNAVPVLPGAGA